HQSPKDLVVLTNGRSGNFRSHATVFPGSSPNWVVAADLNADGKTDLVGATTFKDNLMVFNNDGSGNFVSNATLSVGSYPYMVAVADTKGIGRLDLISPNYFDST